MSAQQSIPFDDPLRGGTGDGVRGIAALLDESDIDASADLYDEACELARLGRYDRAHDRLRMLLCLDSNDASAHLLLAKVLAARGEAEEALRELDQAAGCGLRAPEGLREQLEMALHDTQALQSKAQRSEARVQGELRGLREEARRLRAENARLERALRDASDKSRLWMSATAVAVLVGVVALLAFALWGGSTTDPLVETPVSETPVSEDVVVEAPADQPRAPAADPSPVPPEPLPVQDGPSTYTVVSGDSLAGISLKVFGTETRWEEIQAANESLLHGGNALQIGMELQLPE
jgi:tetratricopeptide (TPR) repeat protein